VRQQEVDAGWSLRGERQVNRDRVIREIEMPLYK
jgi:hypothetical protein